MPEPETNVPKDVTEAGPTPAEASATPPPPTSPPPPAAGDAADLSAQLAAAKAEASAHQDRFLRAAADLENFRRRAVREKDELRTAVTGRVLEDIFPVLDNLALAVAAARQPGADMKSLVGGVEMVLNQLKTALSGHGMKEIAPAVGSPFDPHQHEAISHQPSKDVKEEQVLTLVRTGYSLNGRLLRPASVIVSSGPLQESTS